jgi:hypothetical protein
MLTYKQRSHRTITSRRVCSVCLCVQLGVRRPLVRLVIFEPMSQYQLVISFLIWLLLADGPLRLRIENHYQRMDHFCPRQSAKYSALCLVARFFNP